MEPKERIPVINRCARTLASRGWAEIDFILGQFDLPTTDQWGSGGDDPECNYVRDMLGSRYADDENILRLDDYLHEAPTHSSDEEPWDESSCRVFITHLWEHRGDAVDLKASLQGWGIDGFVAHRDINPGSEWVRVITAALHSCNALVALLHDGFKTSEWCDQEVSAALGRRIPVIPIRIDMNPYGLLGSLQAIPWNRSVDKPSQVMAEQLVDLLITDKRTRDRVVEALVQRLPTAGSFKHANNLASRWQQQNASLSTDQIKRLMSAREENDQVAGAYIANPYIEELGKSIEPVREDYGPDEAPF